MFSTFRTTTLVAIVAWLSALSAPTEEAIRRRRHKHQQFEGVTMFSTFRNTAVSLSAVALALTQFASPAQAAYTITLLEVPVGGGITNVVATGSGTIDLTGLTLLFSDTFIASFMQPQSSAIVAGPATNPPPTSDIYSGMTSPLNFGSGASMLASSGTGDIFGPIDNLLEVPHGFTGGALSNSATWDNQTFSSLGVTPGTYEWTWGTGPDQNLTLQINAAAVPEPATLSVLAMGLAGLGMVLRTRWT